MKKKTNDDEKDKHFEERHLIQLNRAKMSQARSAFYSTNRIKKYFTELSIRDRDAALALVLTASTGVELSRCDPSHDEHINISANGTLNYKVTQRRDKYNRQQYSHSVHIGWPELASVLQALRENNFNWKFRSTINRDKNRNSISVKAKSLRTNASYSLQKSGMNLFHSIILGGNASHYYRAPLDYVSDIYEEHNLAALVGQRMRQIIPHELITSGPIAIHAEKIDAPVIPTIDQMNCVFSHYLSLVTRAQQRYNHLYDINSLIDLINVVEEYFVQSLLLGTGIRPFSERACGFEELENQDLLITDKDSRFLEQRVLPNPIDKLFNYRRKLRCELSNKSHVKVNKTSKLFYSNCPIFIHNDSGLIHAQPLKSIDAVRKISQINECHNFSPNCTRHMFARFIFTRLNPSEYTSALGHYIPHLISDESLGQIPKSITFQNQLNAAKDLLRTCGYEDISE